MTAKTRKAKNKAWVSWAAIISVFDPLNLSSLPKLSLVEIAHTIAYNICDIGKKNEVSHTSPNQNAWTARHRTRCPWHMGTAGKNQSWEIEPDDLANTWRTRTHMFLGTDKLWKIKQGHQRTRSTNTDTRRPVLLPNFHYWFYLNHTGFSNLLLFLMFPSAGILPGHRYEEAVLDVHSWLWCISRCH